MNFLLQIDADRAEGAGRSHRNTHLFLWERHLLDNSNQRTKDRNPL
jgi:hypothetical protein